MKSDLLSGKVLIVLMVLAFCSCQQPAAEYYMVSGAAQGTSYHITYQDKQQRNFSQAIDSILKAFDHSLSIYDSTSVISRFNRNDPTVVADAWFADVFAKSEEIYRISNGAFDITVGPVVKAWGFSNGPVARHDTAHIQSLLKYVGMSKVKLEADRLVKQYPETMLDVNAIAQGYSVDLVHDFLVSKGLENILVEIGGEVRGTGKNGSGRYWRIGVDKPEDNNMTPGQNLQAILELNNRALATSGNYRKFYVEDGVKYSHTIDPETGFPAKNTLLSATVVARDAMTADGLATAFMVLGLDKSKQLLSQLRDIEVLFIYNDQYGAYLTYASEGMKKIIVE